MTHLNLVCTSVKEIVISDPLWMVCVKSNSALYILISHLICQALLEECHANDKSYGL